MVRLRSRSFVIISELFWWEGLCESEVSKFWMCQASERRRGSALAYSETLSLFVTVKLPTAGIVTQSRNTCHDYKGNKTLFTLVPSMPQAGELRLHRISNSRASCFWAVKRQNVGQAQLLSVRSPADRDCQSTSECMYITSKAPYVLTSCRDKHEGLAS